MILLILSSDNNVTTNRYTIFRFQNIEISIILERFIIDVNTIPGIIIIRVFIYKKSSPVENH